jgi:hypothetical protein
MEESIFPTATEKHFDFIEAALTGAVLVAFACILGSRSVTGDFEIFGAKIAKENAAPVLSVAFSLIYFAIFINLLRIGDFIENVPASQLQKLTSILATHRWLLNPFADVGTHFLCHVHSAAGCLLILIWWINFFAIYLNMPLATAGIPSALILWLPCIFGAITIIPTIRNIRLLHERSSDSAEGVLAKDIVSLWPFRSVGAVIGMAPVLYFAI